MQSLQSIRGMEDLFGDSLKKWSWVESQIQKVFHAYGYEEIRTPAVEPEALFKRGVGEGTDIVEKEMYSFKESDSESAQRVVLRPEGTAPVVRALIEHKLLQVLPQKVFYMGPMFRKERPQKGRYRQFFQYGFELFGEASAASDFESLLLVAKIYKAVGLTSFEIQINTLGDPEHRDRYRAKLLEYFQSHASQLSQLSQERMSKNPMRIFDSKSPEDQKICEGAPLFTDFLDGEALAHWEELKTFLAEASFPWKLNPRLVRGLDYYTRTVFEIVDTGGNLGSQNALGGGGRYDGLTKDLGGPQVPALGFAGGMERLLLALGEKIPTLPPRFELGVVAIGEKSHRLALGVVERLRDLAISVDIDPDSKKSPKAHFKRADRMKAPLVWILGDEEINQGLVKIKNMQSGEEVTHNLKSQENLRQSYVDLLSTLIKAR